MIAQGLEDIEDYYAAQNVLRDVEAGREKLHKSDDVRRALGLDD
jgi:predicted DNA-binding protein